MLLSFEAIWRSSERCKPQSRTRKSQEENWLVFCLSNKLKTQHSSIQTQTKTNSVPWPKYMFPSLGMLKEAKERCSHQRTVKKLNGRDMLNIKCGIRAIYINCKTELLINNFHIIIIYHITYVYKFIVNSSELILHCFFI